MAKKQSRPAQPITQHHPFDMLPFVASGKRGRAGILGWDVSTQPARDYGEQCEIGTAFAARFVEYLGHHPDAVGSASLGWIAQDIEFNDPTVRGYWVGFFCALTRFIRRGAIGVEPGRYLEDIAVMLAQSRRESARKVDAEASNA
jgi:hypothetical protein